MLGAVAAVSATAIDICLPAQPDIGRTLGASPEAGAALVSGYLLGYGPGQLIWGPLSDRFGRLGLLYLSIAGFIVTSLVCALAGSLDLLFVMRFAQGTTGGGAPVIARAIARDQGGGRETAALISSMTIIIGGAPLIAPLIGSGLLVIADWRWIFGFLALFGVLLIIGIACFLGQRKRRDRRDWVSARVYAGTALLLIREPEFLLGIGIASSVFAGYASVLGAGAVIAQDRFGVSAEAFGPIFSIAAFSFVIGSSVTRRMLRTQPLRRVLVAGAAVVAVAGIGLGYASGVTLPLVPFWGLVCLYTAAFGMLMPTGTAMALEPAGAVAGLASSMIGTGPTLIGALSSMLVVSGLFGDSYQSLCAIAAGSAAIVVVLVLTSLKVCGAPAGKED